MNKKELVMDILKGYPKERKITNEELIRLGFDPKKLRWEIKFSNYKNLKYETEKTRLAYQFMLAGHISKDELDEIIRQEILDNYVYYGKYPEWELLEQFSLTMNEKGIIEFPSGLLYREKYCDAYEQEIYVTIPGEEEKDMYYAVAEYLTNHPEMGLHYFSGNKDKDYHTYNIIFTYEDFDQYTYTTIAWRVFYVLAGLVTKEDIINLPLVDL